MFKRKILFFVIILLFCFNPAYAGVIINEIQLSPTTERFLELYNTGDIEVSLTDWYIQRKTATGSSFGSLISKTNFEGKTIGAHDYFVISRTSLSNSDIVLDSLTLTESNAIQLKNSNEEVVDKIGWGASNDCINPCPPNPALGQSLQKISDGSWIVASPTPGVDNQGSVNNTGADSTNTNTSNSSATGTTSSSSSNSGNSDDILTSPTPSLKTTITVKSVSFVGLPLSFKGTAFGYSGEELRSGKYFWNFGDGSSEEMINNASISHTYLYPGDYLVSLEYYLNPYSLIPDAVNKLRIKIVPLEISISKVGDIKDFYIELTNASPYDIDVSLWQLSFLNKVFTLPRNSNILAKNKITLSSLTTGFNLEDKNDLKLLSPSGKIISKFDENASIKSSPTSILLKTEESKILVPTNSSQNTNKETNTEKPETNLTSSVIDTEIMQNNSSNFFIFSFILIIFLSLGGGAVYFIRRRGAIPQSADDFEILDE